MDLTKHLVMEVNVTSELLLSPFFSVDLFSRKAAQDASRFLTVIRPFSNL